MAKFYLRRSKRSYWSYIYNPRGRAVIRYWFSSIGQMGGTREFNAEFVSNGDTIVCTHGGMARSLSRYLNYGEFSKPWHLQELYDGNKTLARLDKLRKQKES